MQNNIGPLFMLRLLCVEQRRAERKRKRKREREHRTGEKKAWKERREEGLSQRRK